MPEVRILITGSRTWTDRRVIRTVFGYAEIEFGGPIVIVSGACPTGADRLCEEAAEAFGWRVERHPADWKAHGKAAGFIRNQAMVDLGADLCLAFIHNGSRGATHTADAAEAAGIETRRYTGFRGGDRA